MRVLILLSVLLLSSCSYLRKEREPVAPKGIELSNTSDFENKEINIIESALADGSISGQKEPLEEKPLKEVEIAYYTVSKNETLMMIAFKIYGDVSKWKDIQWLNRTELEAKHSLTVGQVLKYEKPDELYSWSKNGNPYLIKRGDYLHKISRNVYGYSKFWPEIWTNNKNLIKDPNTIYAGFTIYYPELNLKRDMAGEKQ